MVAAYASAEENEVLDENKLGAATYGIPNAVIFVAWANKSPHAIQGDVLCTKTGCLFATSKDILQHQW